MILEDSILSGLQALAFSAETAMLQQQITNCAEKFNQLGSDYQDLALSLNKSPQGTTNDGKKVLLEIDELSKQHLASTLAMSDYDMTERKCCNACLAF